MNILITGGLGFQGTHLTKRLLEAGHKVWVVNTPSEDALKNLTWLQKNTNVKNLGIMWGSITDNNVVDRLFGFIHVVFHLAAKVNVDESILNPQVFIDTNISATTRLLQHCVANNVRMIMASTCEVYGGGKDLDEDSPLNPKSPYAASKAGADRMAFAFSKTYGNFVDIVRPFNVYGPLQKEGKFGAVIAIFTDRALKGETLFIHGDGSQARDFIFIDNVVDGYMAILECEVEKDNRCRVFTFGTGVETTIKDIAEVIAREVPDTKIEYVDARPGEVDTFIAKKRIEDYFPDKTTISFEDGMKKYLEYKRNEYNLRK